MATPFIARIDMFAGNFAPRGYAFCNGQLLSIAQFTALFALIGTIYGGDGQTTFALPDMRSRVPVHAGSGPGLSPVQEGQQGGIEAVTLTTGNMPAHNHTATATLHAENKDGTVGNPTNNMLASPQSILIYTPTDPVNNQTMHPDSVQVTLGAAGGSQSVGVLNPTTAVNFIIALEGVFPSRN